jgi:glucose-1-phosphate thymidylyltransferase
MKGIVLAGGRATRLRPLTKITSKQLLPLYNKPMIYYPLQTLLDAGIKDILIIIAPDYAGQFLNLLGSGKEFGARFSYEIQDAPRGLSDAFIVGENFIGKDNVTMILGDNVFVDHDFSKAIKSFKSGGMVFAKKVPDPERFGVVEFDKNNKVISIEEKPAKPKSNFAVVGLYIYDNRVIKYAKALKPSPRGEIEITDLNNRYLEKGELKVNIFDGIWEDAGTFDSLLRIQNIVAEKERSVASSKLQVARR